MAGSRTGPRRIVLGLALVAALSLGLPAVAQAKKAKTFSASQAPNASIPDATAAAFSQVDFTAQASKKFKGLKIRDVNVTVQTTGSSPTAAAGLIARLTAPSGAAVLLFLSLSGQNVGPLTLDDESRLTLTGTSAQASKYFLRPPYIGTAQPGSITTARPLAVMDDDNVRGTWTLSMFDQSVGGTSVLNSWSLQVKTRKPYVTD